MGRPRSNTPKLTPEERKELRDAFEKYINDNDDPRLAGFLSRDPIALKFWVSRKNMYDWNDMQGLLDRAHLKQEDYLNQKGMNGQATAMAIFRLKQPWHGYRDKFEQDVTSNGEKITFVNSVPRPQLEEDKLEKRKEKYGPNSNSHFKP